MANKNFSISKSQYLVGLDCKKALWLSKNRKDLDASPDASAEYRYQVGNEVGDIAKRFFGAGYENQRKYFEIEEAYKDTKDRIGEGETLLYEGLAIHTKNKAHARADVLRQKDGSWELYEVKSSTSAKDYHIDDLSFQFMVFNDFGLDLKKIGVLHLNKNYKRKKDIKINSLLEISDVTENVLAQQNDISQKVEDILAVYYAEHEPSIDIGSHCKDCSYKEYCWREKPKYNIFNIYRGSKAEKIYKNNASVAIEDLSKDEYPKGNKKIDVQSYLTNEIYLNKKKLTNFLDQIEFPIFYLDFETFSPAIPLFLDTKPYQHIPFQLSLHIEEKRGGVLKHKKYLHKQKNDPRLLFAETLIKICQKKGTILVYNQSFEMNIIKLLAESFPHIKDDLLALNDRMVDLLEPFRSRYVYSSKQMSSASIKKVLPAFTSKSYNNLAIQDGLSASIKYEDFFNKRMTGEELEAYWEAVDKYCELDTMGMVDLLKSIRTLNS